MKKYLLMLFTWWGASTFGTWVHTMRHGVLVGRDEFGNKYYKQNVSKNKAYSGSRKGERRWVMYANDSEASAIPVGWHGWMHYRTDVPPSQDEHVPWPWERKHKPNMTGTPEAYRPAGSILSPQSRDDVSGDYEAWTP
ncbi:NADH:ubiquinone oxidoreductase subunit NDUFA12 [Cohaesibacter celericrescens]|uniref:NADH:ubiquinone oxidoreductase subunit NDUFA12 n=1 Tax=Cohaesibacter celericrescens TaxID=2067669 RepID=A0A2N5XSK5_9HYPH|nr:NADH:ubiquinone oxidoreductase subunit NDUFA12 [Cohaesibacter celericrescens]PLW77427.1 NADH:ubiquinone oxidoreductase subunit NDUFA12 [Cohaesibacter celericrescens]